MEVVKLVTFGCKDMTKMAVKLLFSQGLGWEIPLGCEFLLVGELNSFGGTKCNLRRLALFGVFWVIFGSFRYAVRIFFLCQC